MEIKRNQKYFASKGINVILIVGLVICLVAIALFFERNTRPFGLIILLVGSAVAVFGAGAKSGEADIDNQIHGIVKDIPEQAQIKHEVYERHFLRIINPVFLKGFDYSSEELLCKKGPDHKFRTQAYNAAQLYFTKEKIYIYGKHICLIDDSEAQNYEFSEVILYENVEKAYVEPTTVKVNGREVKVFYFVLQLKDGTNAIKISVDYGADVDKACDDINHVTEKMTILAQERAADKAAKRAFLREQDALKAAAAAAAE
ncbi:MAG: hypothetical protein IJF69_00615 [Clostridia bacterium]|nr:hypothetical protein [Clostridia bacterium]